VLSIGRFVVVSGSNNYHGHYIVCLGSLMLDWGALFHTRKIPNKGFSRIYFRFHDRRMRLAVSVAIKRIVYHMLFCNMSTFF
jgi:hypothetical protein